MDWNKDKSVMLSRGCIILFSVLLAITDIGSYWLVKWFISLSYSLSGLTHLILLMTTVLSCSIFAWILLINLWKLLTNIRNDMIFESSSVKYLRITAWCCAGVCTICLLSTLYFSPLIIISVAAGFIALIVRIIKNIFEQAISMKNELDFTV